MKAYAGFAAVYDIMQYDVAYELWAEKFYAFMKHYGTQVRTGLEIGCGTAAISILLSKKGLVMDGLDLSDEMLTMAREKTNEANVRMKFFQQNMLEMQLNKRYDAVIAPCDGLNYLKDEGELTQVFQKVHAHLKSGGVFIFDLSTHYKFSKVIGDATFAETFENSAYIWENSYDEEQRRLVFILTLFVEDSGNYRRIEEYHEQYAYENEVVQTQLMPYFDVQEIVDGDTFQPIHAASERICFICKRKEEIV
ncbi:class I SAM-dependent methyltransferase [Fusibacter paucivorans]|uniref:Class I SAM-dependent methyltransferase n=1 Tax=Fusibacter paucivorans TaxID=76009 RepID=A0ABS5PKH6_9FIRM|nr:class I SAM-dependent methyltransferase [Fusibacter paucivorans]MBS7525668.1 class I SAM-dependent methyltransferase [Fusibacter paucivorans]